MIHPFLVTLRIIGFFISIETYDKASSEDYNMFLIIILIVGLTAYLEYQLYRGAKYGKILGKKGDVDRSKIVEFRILQIAFSILSGMGIAMLFMEI